MARTLTSDDLDAYGDLAFPTDPQEMLAELVAAVDEDRIADPEDVPYALTLAASAAAKLKDEARALELSARGVEVSEGRRDHFNSRGEHADLLLRYGHEDDGMALLRALRPQLSRDLLADHYVITPLVENGRHELAEEWLTAALATALGVADRAEDDSDVEQDAFDIADRLLVLRYDLRREMDLPLDETDRVAEQVDDDEVSDFRFWPEAAYAKLLAALPPEEDDSPPTWDEHRAVIERRMQASDPSDLPVIEVGTPDMLAVFLADDGTPVPPGPLLPWPPGRNDPCWCGSRVKYKKCCLPRGRG
ncbi:SEC-C domain-containing protein [Actinomycetospora termitidis]|uniref:SEC-C domain-containing protein n=1 Tax=Actinomycetospora termitidis TaxID=3053470 RepID=A0ABT7MLE0_9PSEU|nr:SEC-C domain-containing protein [Actinomycetospora sp. Odt1-22]MDL5160168.1 SEC-C domain-containing protein [Actinomycetospora sp. Odt1-22]